MARPTSFSTEIADLICEKLVEGESLRAICRQDGMPGLSTVFRWLGEHDGFRDQYARAREAQADTYADEITLIADTPMEGVIEEYERRMIDNPDDPEGEKVEEFVLVKRRVEDMLAHRKLQIDTRKWVASKLKPKKYGEKVDFTGSVTLEQLVAGSMARPEQSDGES